jgi:glycosyltransferase involved in cell wall biosynthesis
VAVVHQILPHLEWGDAISNYAILLRNVLRNMGHRSRIYARFIHPRMYLKARPLGAVRRLAGDENIVWMYHYSTASEITRMVRNLSGRMVLLYHNITPPTLTLPRDGLSAARSHAAGEELKSLTDLPRVAVGDSEYNRTHLVELGFRNTEVLPIILDYGRYSRAPRRSIVARYRDGGVNFLTVGRVVPHKRIEDVIRVFHRYREGVNSHSRLFVVGDTEGMREYAERLSQFCRILNLSNVFFTGKVSFRTLLAFYRIADVYVCMSEHEGFGVPLLESMYLGVPIIANLCTAVGETMGDAGILVREKRFEEIAEMAHLLVTDSELRARVIAKQKERARFFSEDYLAGRLNHILARARE